VAFEHIAFRYNADEPLIEASAKGERMP